MINTMRKLFIVVLVFMLLYFPPVVKINMIYIVEAILIILFLISLLKNQKLVLQKYYIYFFVIFGIVILLQGLIAVVHGYSFLNANSDNLLILFGLFISTLILNRMFVLYSFSNEEIIKILFIVSLIQSALSIYAFINRDFQQWFIQKMIDYGYNATRFSQLSNFRWFGVATQLGYATPVVQTVFSLIAIYLGIIDNKKYLTYVPFMLFSAIINARISIIIFAIGLIYTTSFVLKRKCSKKTIQRIWMILVLGIIFFAIALLFLYTTSYSTYVWLVYGIFDMIGIQMNVSGIYAIGNYFTSSSNYLLPNGLDLISGIGINLSSANIGFTTDIGYIIDIWKFGILITPILYFLIYRLTQYYNWIDDRLYKYLRNLILLTLFISNFKGNVISATPIAALVIFFIFGFPKKKHGEDYGN